MNLSTNNKTWIFDLDGTMLVHNGHLSGNDELLPGVKKFFQENIKSKDYVLILTARKEEYSDMTIDFLNRNNIRYDHVIFNMPHGERVLFNDKKESGMLTAYSKNFKRNEGFENFKIEYDDNI